MRVLQKLVLDCDPDAAWRALHSPHAIAELYGPLVTLTALEDLPTQWGPGGESAVRLGMGPLPLGSSLIATYDIETTDSRGSVRIMRDAGMPLTGPLAALDVWDHQMAVAAAPGEPGRTLWRERLVIGGAAAPALWPVLWTVWQWRAARLRALARTWAFDPEAVADPETDADPVPDPQQETASTRDAEPASGTERALPAD